MHRTTPAAVGAAKRQLTLLRTASRGAYVAAARGAQGLVLLASVTLLPERSQSDVALAIVIVGALNLITNFGIPTLVVRHWRSESDCGVLGRLVQWYLLFTCLGCLIAAIFGSVALQTTTMTVCAAALFLGTSLLSGLEYWSLAEGSYDDFLRGPGLVHAGIALLAPLAVVGLRRADLALGVLAFAAFSAFVTPRARAAVERLRRAASGHIARPGAGTSSLRADALRITAGTAAAAVLYGADVVILRASGLPGQDAEYRLGITAVGFIVALVPAGFFALADASTGVRSGRRERFGYPALAAGATALLGAAAWNVAPASVDVGYLLVAMSPLAAIRVATQVGVSEQHGRGSHLLVARNVWIASGLVAVVGTFAVRQYGLIALVATQTVVECALTLSLSSGAVAPRSRDAPPPATLI